MDYTYNDPRADEYNRKYKYEKTTNKIIDFSNVSPKDIKRSDPPFFLGHRIQERYEGELMNYQIEDSNEGYAYQEINIISSQGIDLFNTNKKSCRYQYLSDDGSSLVSMENCDILLLSSPTEVKRYNYSKLYYPDNYQDYNNTDFFHSQEASIVKAFIHLAKLCGGKDYIKPPEQHKKELF